MLSPHKQNEKLNEKKPKSADKNIPANVTAKNRFKDSKPMVTVPPPMKVIGAYLPVTVHNGHVQNTSFPCPFCSSTNTKAIASSHIKCLSCQRQYVEVTTKPKEVLSLAAFYGNVHQRATTAAQATNGNLKPSAKRTSTNKVCRKSKMKAVEMVDLVSSDEEENTPLPRQHKVS